MGILKTFVTVAIVMAAIAVTAAERPKEPPPTWPWLGPTPPEIRDALVEARNRLLHTDQELKRMEVIASPTAASATSDATIAPGH